MQTLEIINVGQAPNDGTGEDHRSAFQKVNANFGKVAEGVGEVGAAAQSATAAAQAAGQVAAGAIPASEKGEVGGVAPLDGAGKVPAAHLPEQEEFIPMAQKGVAEGVATLGTDGKVNPSQLPNAVDAIPLAQKGQPGGVATLDEAGFVPKSQSRVDVEQLASDYAVLNEAIQTLHGQMSQVSGVGQSLQDVTANRAGGVVYTNSTNRPIFVYVYGVSTTSLGYLFVAVNASPVGLYSYPQVGATLAGCFVVPAGATYNIDPGNANISKWREYR